MIRVKAVAFVVVTGMLAACAASGSKAPQGGYANYHAYLVGTSMKSVSSKAPAEARAALANCYANFAVAQVNNIRQMEVLDMEASSSDPTASTLIPYVGAETQTAYGSTNQQHRAALESYCPDTIAQYGQYLPD
jgi:hypothetical protein